MRANSKDWHPARHWLFFWRLERVAMSNWAGTGFKRHKYSNGMTRVFWTRRQAQRRADLLNAGRRAIAKAVKEMK